jgi:multidrug efflux pump subunit AcrA (membrane-fusion protein)
MRKMLAPLIIIIFGISVSLLLVLSKPSPEVVLPEKKITKVYTTSFKEGDYPAIYHNTGVVKSSQNLHLTSAVSGTVSYISEKFIPGHIVQKGEVLVELSDFTLKRKVKISEANLKQAKAAYEVELGKQQVAKQNVEVVFKATGTKPENKSLMLRAPQLEHAKADLAKAQHDLELANSDLEDATIRAPFNAMILSKNVSMSENITAKSSVFGDLVDIDQYWIEILAPDGVIPWLNSREINILAKVYPSNSSESLEGYVLKTIMALDESSRMARVIVAVNDPMQINKVISGDKDRDHHHPFLMLNDYVDVTIIGKTIKSVFKMPIDYLRSNNTVWVFSKGKLDIKPVSLIYKDKDFVYIKSGISSEDKIITTNIGIPVNNMHLENLTTREKASNE